MGFEYDESSWPIVRARWLGAVTDAEVSDALARIDRWVARGQRFGLLIDARGGGGMSPEQRNRLIAHMKAHAEITAKYLVQAVVFDNLVQRTLYYWVNLLFPSPFPSKAFADPVAAEAWLASVVGAASSKETV
jgi:hypothetical protein